jgi:threonine/homoserine/homoserine lactone efflux protein
VKPETTYQFLLTSLVVVLVPGTGVVYTISSAIGGGWRRGLFAAIGCTLGIVPHLLAAMLGLSGIMQAGAVAFETVRWVGVAYLVFMGVSMIRDGGTLRLDDDRTAATDRPGVVVRRGILLNLLNPKLTVFFFAFLPQFLDRPPGLLDPRLVGLGGIFMLMTLAVFVVYAWTSATVRERVLAAPGVLRWVRRSMGVLLIGFAARLAVTDR